MLPDKRETGYKQKFLVDGACGSPKFIELSALRTAGAGWLVNDTLVLTVDVTVEHEDRFQVDTGALVASEREHTCA